MKLFAPKKLKEPVDPVKLFAPKKLKEPVDPVKLFAPKKLKDPVFPVIPFVLVELVGRLEMAVDIISDSVFPPTLK